MNVTNIHGVYIYKYIWIYVYSFVLLVFTNFFYELLWNGMKLQIVVFDLFLFGQNYIYKTSMLYSTVIYSNSLLYNIPLYDKPISYLTNLLCIVEVFFLFALLFVLVVLLFKKLLLWTFLHTFPSVPTQEVFFWGVKLHGLWEHEHLILPEFAKFTL